MNKHRFELFSDGVFAIVLTLLVLDLRVPEAHGLKALAEVWPSLLVHVSSFVLVGVFWIIHQAALERVTAFSVAGSRWNLVCLFWSTLIPFAAKNAAERPLESLGPSLVAASTGFYILSMLALRLTLHSTVEDTPEGLRWRRRRFTIFLILGLADVLAAGLSWILPIAGYLAVAVTVGYVLIASHPAVAERQMRGVVEAGEADPLPKVSEIAP
jgi:uncharacterized membrane protein